MMDKVIFAQAGAESASSFPTAAVIVLILGFIAAATVGSLAWFQAKGQFWWQPIRKEGDVDASIGPKYDSGIIPAENVARQQREGTVYKQTPQPLQGDTNTTDGFTVDREGLLNNYAVMPEPYVNEPGDLKDTES